MRLRPTALLGAVFGAAALASAFVISQLPREGEVASLPPVPLPATLPETTPTVSPPMTATDGTAELRVTAGGEPLAGATVALFLAVPEPGDDAPGWRRAGTAATDKDGIARLPARAGLYVASARAPGLAPGRAVLARAGREPISRAEIALAPPVALEGTARTADGRAPPARVRVEAVPLADGAASVGVPATAPPEETFVAETDGGGAFRIAGLAPGLWAVRATAPGFHPLLLPRVAVPRAAPLAVRLEPLGAIAGEVRYADGRPAAGAEVLAAALDHVGRSTADAEGRFSISIPAGAYRVVARTAADAGAVAAPIAVAPGATTRGAEVRLGPAAALEVTVTRAGGVAAAGAVVVALAHETGTPLARGTAGPDGVVHLAGLPPAAVDVRADLLGATPARETGVTLSEGQVFPLSLALGAPGAVEGTVKDGAGRLLAGARVRVVARGDGLAARLPLETGTDFDGRFRVAGLEAGRAEVIVSEAGADLGEGRAVVVPAGGAAHLDLVLPAAGVLTGRAAGEDHSPPPLGTAVVAAPLRAGTGTRAVARVLTDAHGNYRLVLPAGEYRVHAAPAEADDTDLRVAPGFVRVEPGRTAQLDVPTSPATTPEGIEIAVVEPGGAPSPGAVVTLGRADDPKVALAQAAGEDGRVRLAKAMGLAGQPVAIRAHAGGRTGAWAGVLPASGTVTVALTPGGALQGIVRTHGRRVAGFTLEVASQPTPEGWRTLDVHRFAGDRFDLADLPAEPLRLVVRADDGRRGSADVRLAPGERQGVEIAVEAARPGP